MIIAFFICLGIVLFIIVLAAINLSRAGYIDFDKVDNIFVIHVYLIALFALSGAATMITGILALIDFLKS